MIGQRGSNAASISIRWFAAALAMTLAALLTGGAGVWQTVNAEEAQDSVTVRLRETHDSGITGRATLTTVDGVTSIRVSVKGEDQQYLPYVRRGTCTTYKENPAIPLSLTSPEKSTKTTIDVSIADLQSDGYVVDLHVAAGDLASLSDSKTSVACGAISTIEPTPTPVDEVATVTDPPVAGVGGFDASMWAFGAAAVMLAVSMLFAATGFMQRRTDVVVTPASVSATAMRRLRGLSE